jgi:uncharacterized glyoxalase superfamily protein PhnB
MRYRNVAAAVEWLCKAFGFEKHHVVSGGDGTIAVAQLSFGANMIMLLPVGGSELDRLMKQPDEIGGAETQSCYLVVGDIDSHYGKAKSAGAQFVLDLKEYDNGGRGFSCRDPEGHIWSFGTYDPWQGSDSVTANLPAVVEPAPPGKRSTAARVAALVVIAVAAGIAGWGLATLQQAAPGAEVMRLRQEAASAQQREREARDHAARESAGLSRERSEREAIERAAKQAAEQLAGGQSAKEAAERAARQAETQLSEERRAKEAAERAAKSAAEQIARERTAKQAAQNATSIVQKELALARAARQLAEQATKEATEQLARERAAREAAERAVKGTQAKPGQSQNEKGLPPPANADQSLRKMSKKSGESGSAEPMPPLLP